jgi:hypothetical protein
MHSYFQPRSLLVSCLAVMVLMAALYGCSSGNELVSNGKSDYKIFVSKNATIPEKSAAIELQKYLKQITDCDLEITNTADANAKLVYIGFQEADKSLLKDLDIHSFGNEEYIIRSDGKNLLIAGGDSRGTVYGVSAYLTDYLGCRWYTREVIKIPKQATLLLSKIDDRQKPAFEYREPYFHEAYNTEWALHNKTNTRAIPDSLGGAYIIYPFVHTFNQLVPPDKYFKTHPEYFSLVGGERKKVDSQLCLTNPEVVKIATATVFEWIKSNPKANVFSIDQNDFDGNCECVHCKKIDDAEGSPSGSLLTFVNQIADTVGKVYPDIKFQTLAYYYTEVPPKTIRPADNVTIRLCHYEYCSAHPLGKCDSHKPYVDRLEQWKKIAKRVTVWDYYTQFAAYLMPFPNFETIKHDVKFYADHGVIGLFAQGNNVPSDGNGEFSELRAWVFAQLMWNPEKDAQGLIDEFVQNVYGSASPYVSEYIKLLHDQVKPDSAYFSIWTEPQDANYLNLKTIQKADSLFADAKKAAASDSALFKRVERAYLPVIYTKLYFHSIGGTAFTSKNLAADIADFKRIIAENKITTLAEEPVIGSIASFLDRVESNDQFINDWWITGPFPNPKRKGLEKVYGPELKFDSTQTFTGENDLNVKWIRHNDRTTGHIDFAKIFGNKKDVVSYAYTRINMPEARPVKFGIGSNDGVRVWINGKLVLERVVSRKAIPNNDQIVVPMLKGENTVLVKVDQLGNKWGFFFTKRD